MDNVEVACTEIKNGGESGEIKTVRTPDIKDIESLAGFTKISPDKMIKACVFAVEGEQKPCVVFIRGDFEVNETKLKKALKKNIFPLDDYEGAIEMGYIGPVGFDSENATVLFDESLIGCKNMLCGANKKDYHYSGVSIGRDFTAPVFYDLYKVREGDKCLKCGKALKIKKGIEIGNIFQLGKKYTESMNMTYLDEKGERKTPIMGCYGIGIGRSLASVIEERHDNYGPIWPFAIAPWHIHICMLGGNEEMKKSADALYEKLLRENFEVIYDDRAVSAGVMFSDADLLGVPYRVIFGSKNFANGNAEIISRDKSFRKIVKTENLYEEIKNIIKEEKEKL
jgi:prolyl-tRNA synthetase